MGKCHDLLEAARNGNIAIVGKILEQCAKKGGPLSSFRRSPSINWQDVNGYTPLHHACLNGHIEIVRLLLAHDVITDIPDIRGSTPLYLASWAGHREIVKMLLLFPHKPANPNAQTIENETALHCAAQHGHNVVVAILLDFGADPTIRNNSFQTALDLAAQFGRLQVVQILIRAHPELIEPFRLCDEIVALDSGHSSPYTITPTKHIYTHSCLHLAARNGHKKVVETLLAAGVYVNILTHAGSALHEAALCGKKSVVCTLLRAGIDPYAIDGNGRTALDILGEYPPHVTYEIVSIINDFCQDSSNMLNRTHFMPIKDVNENNTSPNYMNEVESNETPDYDKPQMSSIPMNSLEHYNITTERYTPMEPLKWTKSNCDLTSKSDEETQQYKLVNKSNLFFRRLGAADTNFPKFSTTNKIQNKTPLNSKLYRCVDEYVEMSMPTSNACNTPRTPRTPVVTTSPPLPSPRGNMEYGDYANINIISAQNKHAYHDDNTNSYESNNNNQRSLDREHSPTPDCPPPTAKEAETTIYELVKPPDKTMKRKSLQSQEQEPQFYEGLKSFIWEDQMEPLEEEQLDSLSSSRISECVEEFVSDVPFGGLFKGSSLNLVNGSSVDLRSSPPAIEDVPSGLRSPSLVRSVKPIPKKRNVTIKTPTSSDEITNELDFDASKVWEEINTIFESIGNEVSANEVSKLEVLNDSYSLTNTLRKKTLNIRQPAELLLGSISQDQNASSNWCHSANTLIYGYVIYNVFYLGSTVIRELHGTASTRKSIQKLKREESTPPQEDNDESIIISDINSSTRILKESNQQSRLDVGIAVSHAGVRFIDTENKNTICVHDIENINCVSQDTDDMRYFAYITRENDIHYCHVFMVDDLNLATEIILTLGQAFEVAYQLSLFHQAMSHHCLMCWKP